MMLLPRQALLALLLSTLPLNTSVISEPLLKERPLKAWREELSLKKGEAPWESIPWLPTFSQGILVAGEKQKPLLLWVMNGHPLGCT